MNKLKLFWFCFYIIAMLLAFLGSRWVPMVGFVICVLLVMDLFFLFHAKYAKKWKAKWRANSANQGLLAGAISSFTNLPIVAYVHIVIRSSWGLTIICMAFLLQAETPRLEILPMLSFLESESRIVSILYNSFFSLILATGILLSSKNYLDVWKSLRDPVVNDNEYFNKR